MRPQFEEMLEYLKKFKEENGHVDPAIDTVVEDKEGVARVKIGRWINAVRRAKSNGHLKPERQQALDALDPNWTETKHALVQKPSGLPKPEMLTGNFTGAAGRKIPLNGGGKGRITSKPLIV